MTRKKVIENSADAFSENGISLNAVQRCTFTTKAVLFPIYYFTNIAIRLVAILSGEILASPEIISSDEP
ncbi:hypothetical protein AXE85_00445 [Gemella sp. oral taxon 928]|nr:hypothetical protein AXE85_00445 [Gemella sp. oral taxon 928]AXI26342.1 hypothetical protein CG018_02210 [Gemella sp. ND 6198]